MNATPADKRLMDVVGDPTAGGTLPPPAAVTIPWAEWEEFTKAMKSDDPAVNVIPTGTPPRRKPA